ncbi:dephospho-CoA kinase [Alloscardovia criceti]|uniref:dephospho-CoA kinase n=1 Tax=Alloscardovia criceti TaxID=356828 RepID=UPI0004780DEF|nr:dephospho-CoA kinase [Alloscardovia criceti]
MTSTHPKFIRVGITGGIAAGKSTVSNHLIERGFPVIDYDKLARDIVRPGSPVLREVAQAFGEQALDSHGMLNRPWLAEHVFQDDHQLRTLNGIMHPAVYRLAAERESRILAEKEHSIIFHDIPLLVETRQLAQDNGIIFDHIMTVEASKDVRIARMMESRHMTAADAQSRIAMQLTRAQREEIADLVIDSQRPLETMLAQVDSAVDNWLRA